MPNLATGLYRDAEGTVVLVVQNDMAPTNEEWDLYLANIRSCLGLPNASGIAFTDGGTPDAQQRARVNEVLGGHRAPSAVVSNSLAVRGVVTALSWFNPATAAFPPRRVEAACRFARIEGPRIAALWRAVRALDRQLTPCSRVVVEASLALRGAE